MTGMIQKIADLRRRDEGVAGVEYSVLIALIIAICIAVILALGLYVQGGFDDFDDKMTATGAQQGVD